MLIRIYFYVKFLDNLQEKIRNSQKQKSINQMKNAISVFAAKGYYSIMEMAKELFDEF